MKFNLIVDTSTERGLVVLTNSIHPLFISPLPYGYQSSKWVFPAIEAGFKQLSITLADIRFIGVSTGPGLFTGIRVGVAVAKGLAFAQSLPLVGLSSLEGFTLPTEGRFISLIDLRLAGLYWMIQERKNGRVTSLTFPKVSSLEAFLEELEKKALPIVGPALQKFKFQNTQEVGPDAEHLAYLAEKRYQEGVFSHNGEVPIEYVRECNHLVQ